MSSKAHRIIQKYAVNSLGVWYCQICSIISWYKGGVSNILPEYFFRGLLMATITYLDDTFAHPIDDKIMFRIHAL